jgi:c-di-GMP-specific phosphodiesterase
MFRFPLAGPRWVGRSGDEGGRVDPGFGAETSARLLAFAEQTADFVGVADPWGRILYLNPAARKRLGVADIAGLTVADVFPPEAFAQYHEVVRPQLLRTGAWSGEVPVIVAGSDAIPMYMSTTAEIGPGGEINETVVYAHEPSRVESVAGSARVPGGDRMAESLEPAAFADRVGLVLGISPRDHDDALVLATVSMSDAIDTFDGYAAANVMRALAGRMTRLARAIDIVGQVDARQLGLLLRGVRSHGEALRIARTVAEALVAAPVAIPGGEITPSVSCGVALTERGDDFGALIQRATATMWHEPAARIDVAGGTRQPLVDRTGAWISMDEFRVGMTCGEVRPYAQPIVDLASGFVVGYRGLARWQHRQLGMLEAAAFIEMIAETPLANQVDLYVARETAAVLTLTTRTHERPRLYTPLSQRSIADFRTEQYLCEIADAFFLTPSQLRLQVARHSLDEWTPSLDNAARSLRDNDFTLVLTGGEQLSDAGHAAEHGFVELHLSRRLTSAAATDPDARSSATELVRQAHRLGLLVAATGVNDEHHRAVLLDAGCDFASGDLYGAPRPADTIE